MIEIGPSAFANDERTAINWQGQNYYKSCDEFVRNTPDGGSTYCVKRSGHPSTTHEDSDGCISVAEESLSGEEDSVKDNPEVYRETKEILPDDEITISLTITCKDREEIDYVMGHCSLIATLVAVEGMYANVNLYNSRLDNEPLP